MPSDSFDHDSESFENGLRVRRAVMGDDFVDAALARTDGTASATLQQFVTEHVWDAVWNREGLERRDRSLLNIGILTALRAHEELVGHVRGALTNGLTQEEIVEAIVHTAGYCGAPAALSAMKVAQQVFDAHNAS
ncbi:4-carboxymuconolactone decarboxylase [Gordonia desulfuricans]|uniref:4-carboxymuconolactone decarboxylase n=1 Tax=Gordonia desulfuricans TaxID=89051 RepID=A0A7K3LMW8_9ACTN|nr:MULTISPECIES: carboxymuconolactone decarboxylase family protein [Gordonia]EMP12811.2 4-carboxymuconolactone decarboxylase [Gordonia sp. NB41Y]NDK88877.1 4-carboxymuconolactone decarboxylase [Gordonia desulfuricans]WLP88892.1 carboxymuconolactone decarboxylase family protein [Gordonia sp. NB41Y]